MISVIQEFDNLPGIDSLFCSQVLMEHLTEADYATLAPKNLVNDKIINNFMKLVERRSCEHPDMKSVLALNSFFFKKWEDSNAGYDGIKKWFKKNPFNFDFVLFPLHQPSKRSGNLGHWSLLVVRPKKGDIVAFDSLGHQHNKELNQLHIFFREEALKRAIRSDFTWTTLNMLEKCPQQRNQHDCGVYVCLYADLLTADKPLNYIETQTSEELRKTVLRKLKRANPAAPPIRPTSTAKKVPSDIPSHRRTQPLPLHHTTRPRKSSTAASSKQGTSKKITVDLNSSDELDSLMAAIDTTTEEDGLLREMSDFLAPETMTSVPVATMISGSLLDPPTAVDVGANVSTLYREEKEEETHVSANPRNVQSAADLTHSLRIPRGKTKRGRIFLEDGSFIRMNKKRLELLKNQPEFKRKCK